MRQLKISRRITSRESAALDKYLSEISRIQTLTPEQEVSLAQKWKLGDQDALELLVKSNLKFVISVAKQYQNNGLTLNDLINEGNVGLLKAAKRFDETKGFKFITYAVWWIRQSILQAIVENSRMIRLPYNKHHLQQQINEKHQAFLQEFEREPSPEELSELFHVEVEDVYSLIGSNNSRHVSLDEPLGQEEGASSILDGLKDDSVESPDLKVIQDSMKDELRHKLLSLSPRERDILIEIYGLDDGRAKTIEDVAEIFDISIERVRQLREHAFRRLKRSFAKSTGNLY
ncbi:MAG: RNA polymerase sigma factor RpoD/SigA [Saprospiraceae bacterium]|jgi:RNA polymerase primary sigma factor|nr:RNA polymerase sigma factor RpoD/SigA [Saprospiraceae bacterium]MBK7466789.1 RNA polymerase sigma factor RpoD/SigA [Saprospiraceae bacterium]MBK9994532.1 RNA polymerase sigma factor RpoD/SigA [Saprospiraceae bacterium]